MSDPKPTGESAARVEEPKLSAAELKKRAKAEKQARRAAQKEQQQGSEASPSTAGPSQANHTQSRIDSGNRKENPAQKTKVEKQAIQKGAPKQAEPDNKRSVGAQQTTMAIRRRGSQIDETRDAVPQKVKQLDLLQHLSSQLRRQTVEGAPKDVHPSVLALGFQMSSYEICGSTARCRAMLEAFKNAIEAYTTPTGTSLARHMPSHYLSPQIDFLKSCRPISESMGNSIRWLKNLIVRIDPSTGEQEAKKYLRDSIDNFISERIDYTDQMIANEASRQIEDGAVVLTFANSAIVEKTLLQAHAARTQFRVIVVDSRPRFEGKKLARSLLRAGMNITYASYTALQHAIRDATMVMLGAHSLLSNGMLQSRIGTASVAMAASSNGLPVLICCESVKFSGKSVLDSLALNEVAPPEELLLSNFDSSREADQEEGSSNAKGLHAWRGIQNLQILNLMYDVTPAKYLTTVVCEYGSISPESVQAIHQTTNEGE